MVHEHENSFLLAIIAMHIYLAHIMHSHNMTFLLMGTIDLVKIVNQ